jgi:OmpA-OmpF porin, OOP family
MKLKKSGKIALFALIAIGAFFGIKWYQNKPKTVQDSSTVGKVAIPDVPEASLKGTAAVKYDLPQSSPAMNGGLKVTIAEMPWASQTSLNYANGGERTTKGSLLDKAGFDVQIIRQDDCMKSCADLIKNIKDYKNGDTKDGVFIIFMGSGIPNYLNSIAEAVKDLGPEYQPVAFFSSGKSYGEDQVIGPGEIKRDPKQLKGKVLRGVRLDGDIDIALKFAGDNGVKINANEKTYDPEALNLSYGNDFLSVVNDYNQGLHETRKLVRNGKTAGDTTVSIDLVATWTPGDVNAIVKGKGGATIISTRQYASMMPNIYITCKKFLNDNRSKIEEFIGVVAQAGDQIRTFEDVKKYACKLNAQIWAEEDEKYWYELYNGKQFNSEAFLGGSMVFNLADISKLFGLNGTPDIYKEVYNTFGTLQSKLYPDVLPKYVDYSKAMDKSLIMSVVANHPELLEGKALETKYNDEITDKVASKDIHINFETGSATISTSSFDDLNQIYSSAITAEGLKIGVYGHTDNVGSPEKNQLLSEQRASSVRSYLIKKGLPVNRIESKGYGESEPIADNNIEAGRAQNRRVQIVLGQ